MKVAVIPIVVGKLGMVSKGLEKGLEELKISEELRPSTLLHSWDRLEYWEESWAEKVN